MTKLCRSGAVLAIWLSAPLTAAQVPSPAATPGERDGAAATPPAQAAPDSEPEAPQQAPSGAASDASKEADAEDQRTDSDVTETSSSEQPAEQTPSPPSPAEPAEPPPPPLPAPGASQEPPSVFVQPEPPPEPNLELSIYSGPQWRTSKGKGIDYGTAVAWGVRAGVYPQPWLGARAYARFAKLPVDVKAGGYDTERTQYPDTSFEQGNLDVFGLGFRLEPGPRLGERLRVFGILDVAWMRFVAPEPKARGAHSIRSAERRGVGIDYKLGLGLSFEPIEDWMSIGADATYGFVTRQTGTAFDDVLQGIDDTGSIVHMAALPKFERSIEVLFSIGLIL